ncbi:MAG TPA: hypothetical protein VF209_03120 [Patescibacteria group bacterium]
MSFRPIYAKPYVPRGVKASDLAAHPLKDVSHTPGQAAAIRFFDPHSEADLAAMREILKGKQVKRFMDDARQLSKTEYREWAGTATNTSFLFAVLDARVTDPKEMEYVRGFVYLYSEREEKFRVKRMEKQGFLAPATGERYVLEVSFAVRPLRYGVQSGSGLMSSALRQSCLQVKTLLDSPDRPEVQIFAFVEQGNTNAYRTLEASGFVWRGRMKYDADSPEEAELYFLNWRLLQKKVRERLIETLKQNEQP